MLGHRGILTTSTGREPMAYLLTKTLHLVSVSVIAWPSTVFYLPGINIARLLRRRRPRLGWC